ncbi:MAG TPA: Fe-S cluster assembly protein IscX [Anaerolineae bacterium]|nr:Fe-S cluster assembly protein IscX [Anaerolineae bacterium]HID84220.1 Fe-S cluster assembly protein IscX [Anaerolineales bacterium]HIQ09556.1 Fe-S assembly protein IscX [Anaerolineaceae bacterium]
MSHQPDCEPLTWEGTHALALALHEAHPQVNLDEVSLEQLRQWVLALPCFVDDPALAHEGLLMAVLREWLEIVLEEAVSR